MQTNEELFDSLKESVLELDPVYWCEKYITIDGRPLKLKNGWEPYIAIYRYIAIEAFKPGGKPVVFLKSRQIGGTMASLFIELFLLANGQYGKNGKPPIRVAHLFPILEQSLRFSKTKFASTIATAKPVQHPKKKNEKISFLETRLDSNNSLNYKQFKDNNYIFIESTGLTGDRVRGISADAMLFDEVQNMRDTAIENAIKSLTQAQYGPVGDGIQMLFGTPLKKGSSFHARWLASNQQYYHLGCESCGKHFPLYTPGSDAWENIWIEDDLPKENPSHGFIVRCIHCKHEQDKRKAAGRGKWVEYNNNPKNKYIGFHLNQLFIPNFPRWKIINEKPENHPVNTERAYQNEVLGEFFSGSSATVSRDDIDSKCGDINLRMAHSLKSHPSRRIILGLDWGLKYADTDSDSDESSNKKTIGKSFSTAIILVQEGPKLFKIAWAEKIQKPDLEFRLERVDQLARLYSVDLILGDIGFGYEIGKALQRKYGQKYLAISGLSKITGKFRITEEDYVNTLQFEKDYVLEQVFELLKGGNIKFPYHENDFEKISWLVEHCASMEVKVTYDVSGEQITRYVKGSIPNDGLMSLTYAYVGSLALSSNFFKVKDEDNKDEIGKNRKLGIELGYCKRNI